MPPSPHRKRLLPDDDHQQGERKPPVTSLASGENGTNHSNHGSGGSTTTASSSAASTPSRPQHQQQGQQGHALARRRRGDEEEDGEGERGGDEDQTPWAPAEELRYWAVTRTLRLAVLVAFFGLVQALLSAEAIFWLVLGLASSSSLLALGYARVRERGLLEYLPASTRQLLLQTSLLDWLLDTSMADRIKPYAVLSFGGLNAEERAFLVGSLPREQQRALVEPGMIHALPEVRRGA